MALGQPLVRPRYLTPIRAARFTSEGFTGVLKARGIAINMDGRGRAMYNIFVERLWRGINTSAATSSVKHEDVYLKGYVTLPELLLGPTEYFVFYAPKEVLLGDNTQRTHQSLDYSTSDAVYRTASGGGASIVDKFTEREKVRSEKEIKAETEPGAAPFGCM